MSRTSITIKSLKTLSKVCNSRYSYLDSKNLALLKNLSIAAERSDFQNPNGFDGENSVEYQQEASGFHSPVNYNNVNGEFQPNSSGYFRENLQNPDGDYRGNEGGVAQSPSRVYGHNQRIEFQQNQNGQSGTNFRYSEIPTNEIQNSPVGKNGSFSGVYDRGSTRTEFQQNPVGENWKLSNGYTRESPRNDFQHNPAWKNGGFNGYYGQNAGELSQSPSSFNKESLKDSGKSSNGVFRGNVDVHNSYGIGRKGAGEVQHKPNGFHGQGSSEANGSYGQRTMHSQQSSYNSYSGSSGNFQHVSSNYHGSTNGNFWHVGSNNYGGNTGNYQQSSSGYDGGNAGSPNGYPSEKVGEYMQNPCVDYRTNAGPQQIPNEYQNGMGPDGELVEATDGRQSKSTIEELDDFCKEGKLKEATEVLGLLEQQRIPVDMPRYFMLMKACGEAKALEEAKYVHDHLIRSVSPIEVSSYNKILEMYCSCGSMDDAYVVFNKMPQRNLTSWDTMIIWLAKNDLGEEAIELFTRFKESGLQPDGQMFFSVFSACSSLGDITEGMLHFESMSKSYGIVPSMKHYVSVVDMLGSTGYLDEALEFIEKMPIEPSIDIWESLMNFSRVHGNMELGDRCAELVELLDPSRLHEQSTAGLIPVKASDIAKEKEKKLASQNLLEVRSRVHEYRAGDTSHPDNDKLYALLRGMRQQMKEAGYVAETKFVLHDIDQESKEDALLAHSERLAVAQGLMSSPTRSSIRILKNLRVCGDCHNALKIISKLVGREIIARDAKRFHHFKDGLCSCNDYW